MLKEIIAILIGYLLGSISPAYFLGKTLKGIDIRKEGSGNAGARNVYQVLGLGPAIITGIIDFSKGVLAILLTLKFVQPLFAYLSGWAAIFGHIFPFYLKFKAGQGGATVAGILIYFLTIMLKNHWISWQIVLILSIVAAILLYITKLGPISGLVLLPFFLLSILIEAPKNLIIIFSILFIIFAWIQLLRQFFREKRQVFLKL
jgi:glycerol-3-phosphate acyltransferase PlsY